MRYCVPAVVFALVFVFSGCNKGGSGGGSSSSGGGGEVESVTIGTQVWMKKNLDVDVAGSRCYDNEPANCAVFGRLYDWETAMGVCPEGWHLPSDDEWDVLFKFADSSFIAGESHSKFAGKFLKARSGWSEGGNGTDEFGFAALPGGSALPFDVNYFVGLGLGGDRWSASESNVSQAFRRSFDYNIDGAGRMSVDKLFLRSVRCVKD